MGYWDEREKKPEAVEVDNASLEDFEKAVEEELGDVEKSFRERMANENKRFRDMCDTEYWVAVCFTSREQKEEFLRSMDLPVDEKYIDGREMARKCNRAVKTPDLKFAKIGKPNKAFLDRIRRES